MLGFGWLTLRQAQDALRGGRLDDAQRLLADAGVQGHKRTWDLLQELARAFAERGQQQLKRHDLAAAWGDLVKAEQTGASETAVISLRQALTRFGLADVRAHLATGEAARAVEVVAQLHDRGVRGAELDSLEEAARGWVLALEQADRGEFAPALVMMERIQRLVPEAARAAERALFSLHERQLRYQEQLQALHEAAAAERWSEVLRLTEELLATVPQHSEARALRSRAWKALEPPTSVGVPAQPKLPVAEAPVSSGDRFHLWIDGIGGYLVCLGNRVTLGQATPESAVDVPLLADVSRLHAVLTRDTEGYMLQALRAARLNGRNMEKALLRDGDRITLGGCCQMQFRQPVAVSTSARLDLVSGHRLRLSVDGVLLMADTLVLGPGQQVHVPMPDLKEPLVLYRQKNCLGIRSASAFKINGQRMEERGLLEPGAHVVGEEFAFTLEPVGK
jgi:hypothetical protein